MVNSRNIPILTTGFYDVNKYEPIDHINSLSVHGVSFLRGLVGGITSIFGGRQGVIEEKYLEIRAQILTELQENAQRMGADLVVGLDIDITQLGNEDIIFSANATALKLKRRNNRTNNKKPVNNKNKK